MQANTVSTQRVLKSLWCSKWVIAACVAAGIALTMILAVVLMPPYYETSVVFLVQSPTQDLVESGCHILNTRETLDAVVENASGASTREELSRILTANALGDTPMLEVTVRCSDAATAKLIAEAVAKVFPQRMKSLFANAAVEIADAPELPKQAVGPNYVLVALLGMLVGAAVPACIVTMREYRKVT